MVEEPVATVEMGLVDLHLLARSARLLQARKEKGFTQKDLSLITGISLNCIKQIENLRLVPRQEVMEELSSALEEPVEFLFPQELLSAIEEGVFHERKAQLGARRIVSMTEVKRLGFQPALSLTSGNEEVEKEINLKDLRSQIEKAFGILTPRERIVLTMRFGLDGQRAKTLEEVGKTFGRHKERIRQIEGKALRKLMRPVLSMKLKDYLIY